VIRYFRLLGLRHRLQATDAALDRLQAQHSRALGAGSALAAQRLGRAFDDLAVTRAILACRIERLAPGDTGSPARALSTRAPDSDGRPTPCARTA